MRIGIVSDINNLKVKDELLSYIKTIGHVGIDLNKHDNVLDNCEELVKAYNNESVERGLAIDD
ncbi:MAG: hypothetical protein K2M43_00670 [Mycoplasmoidaceae bacterium]|nr:hypothetical protein [Mycoplasmoidaceae bacterium]